MIYLKKKKNGRARNFSQLHVLIDHMILYYVNRNEDLGFFSSFYTRADLYNDHLLIAVWSRRQYQERSNGTQEPRRKLRCGRDCQPRGTD